MLCLAVVTALTYIVLPSPGWTFLPAIFVLLILLIGIAIMFHWPTFTIGKLPLRFPNLSCSFAMLSWILIDTVAIAGVICVVTSQRR